MLVWGNYHNPPKCTNVSVVVPKLSIMTLEMSVDKEGFPAKSKTQRSVNGNRDRTLEGKQKKNV